MTSFDKESDKVDRRYPDFIHFVRDGDYACKHLTVMHYGTAELFKEAITDPAWIESMQEELLQFKRLNVWVLVPPSDNIKPQHRNGY
ncbi:hypothetical protein Tco_0555961 [Tanacetum coccineum]